MRKILEITDLRKKFGDAEVLHIEHLAFQERKRYAFLGENGSGKSTLLRIIAGVLPMDSGRVAWDDKGMDFAYIPQKPYCLHMPVWKSVTLGLAFHNRKQRKAMASSALNQVGIGTLADKSESNLSGGESQRAMLARILLRERRLLLLDEPTSAVDVEGCALMEAALRKYQERYGCAILFATHSVEQAKRFADEAIVLQNGKIIASGPVAQAVKDYYSISAGLS